MQFLDPGGDKSGGGRARNQTDHGADGAAAERGASGGEDEVDDGKRGQRRHTQQRGHENNPPPITQQGPLHRLRGGILRDEGDDAVAHDPPPHRIRDERGGGEGRHGQHESETETKRPTGEHGGGEAGEKRKADEGDGGEEIDDDAEGEIFAEPRGERGERGKEQKAAERRQNGERRHGRAGGAEAAEDSGRIWKRRGGQDRRSAESQAQRWLTRRRVAIGRFSRGESPCRCGDKFRAGG